MYILSMLYVIVKLCVNIFVYL